MTDSADGLHEWESNECWTVSCPNPPDVRLYDSPDEGGISATCCETCADAMLDQGWSHYTPL